MINDKIKNILESYRKAKNQVISECYKPKQEWGGQVEEKASIFNTFLQNNDYEGLEKTLQNFLANKSLSRGLFNIPNNYLIVEYETWRKKHPSDDQKILTPLVGNPKTVLIGDFCLDEQGGLALHFNHNITWGTIRFRYFAEKTIELLHGISKPFVVEIGGGFGGFAYFLLKKQKNITYINFDLPEMLVISSYYLTEIFPEKKILFYDEYDKSTDIGDYDVVLLPHFELPSLRNESVDIFLNFRSMSEMSMGALQEYMSHAARSLKHNGYLLHENEGIERSVTRNGVLYKRIPCYDFPLPDNFEEISFNKSLFYDNGYFECLYKKTRIEPTPTLIFGGNQFDSIINKGKEILRDVWGNSHG